MKLNYDVYKDKVYACWIGKNIGGTLGGPYEGGRNALDIKGFATSENEVLPNDDLDLQLIWLHAMEHEGPKNISSLTLGEYWLSFIPPYWNEYGIAKRNMERGMLPPLCGEAKNNIWKHSNGAWIRTEIWATLAPASPDIAVRYAMEDAKVDHGMGEGTTAAAFIAAIESAAFVISDINKLIEIGLSKIPQDSRVAGSVRLVMDYYASGKTEMQAREAIIKENADIGDGWFQAPSNIAYVIIGLLYGEGDFKKSMLAAVNCGDDTDCTAATVGAILGIMGGTAEIPTDWRKHIGDKIVTCSINLGVSWPQIKTCTQLTEKVVRLASSVLLENRSNVEIVSGKSEVDKKELELFSKPFGQSEESDVMRRATASLSPNTYTQTFSYATAIVAYIDGQEIASGGEKKISIKLINNVKAYGNQPYTINVRVNLPDGFEADKTDFDIYLPHWTPMTKDCESAPVEITFKAGDKVQSVNTILIEAKAVGRYTTGYIPVNFVNR